MYLKYLKKYEICVLRKKLEIKNNLNLHYKIYVSYTFTQSNPIHFLYNLIIPISPLTIPKDPSSRPDPTDPVLNLHRQSFRNAASVRKTWKKATPPLAATPHNHPIPFFAELQGKIQLSIPLYCCLE